MNHGTLVLGGVEKVLGFFTVWLKTPEERSFVAAHADKVVTEAIKNLAQEKSLELETLQNSIDIFKQTGFDDKAIRDLVNVKVQILLETYEDITTLKRLKKGRVVFKARVYRPGTPRSSG
jgi:uncharacterized protein (UPF0335 family)